MPRAKNGSLTKIGVVWQKSDFWAKNRNFGPKKGGHFCTLTMFWPRPEKVVQRKKCLCPNNQGGKCHFGWFFGVRPIFRPKTTFRPNVKTPVSPWFRPGPGLLSFYVIFLMARTIPPSFVEIGPKLRVVAPLTWEWPKTAKNRGEPQKMTPSPETEIFLGVVPMGKL